MGKWHGYSIGKLSLYVGPLPGRKKIALYSVEAGTLTILAFFQTEEAASVALRALGDLLDARNYYEPYYQVLAEYRVSGGEEG